MEEIILEKDERVICPAIWVEDKNIHKNQPINIQRGYVVYGLHLVDVLYRLYKKKAKHFNLSGKFPSLTEFHEGYYTTKKRFIKNFIKY